MTEYIGGVKEATKGQDEQPHTYCECAIKEKKEEMKAMFDST